MIIYADPSVFISFLETQTGETGSVDDLWRAYLVSQGASAGAIADMELAILAALVTDGSGSPGDLWTKYMAQEGLATFQDFIDGGGFSASAPDAFTSNMWTVADLGTAGDIRITFGELPDANGASITDLEYQLDAGSWTSTGTSTTGTYDIAGLTDTQEYDVKVRAVNSEGNGADSDTKAVTPTDGTFTFSQDMYFHVVSLTDNGNELEASPYYLGLGEAQDSAYTTTLGGDVIIDASTLPNLTNPLTKNLSYSSTTALGGGSTVDVVYCDVFNFVGQPASGTDFDNAVNVLTGTRQHFADEWTTNPTMILQSSVNEPGGSYPWGATPAATTRAQWDAWVDFNLSSTRRDWFDDLVTEAESDAPAGTYLVCDNLLYALRAIRGTALNEQGAGAWFQDNAPHGKADWYALLGMCIYSYEKHRSGGFGTDIVFPAASVTWPTGDANPNRNISSEFSSAAATVAQRIADLVRGVAVTPDALQTTDVSFSTGSGASEIDIVISSLPETPTDIEYRLDGGTWTSLGVTTTGTHTITAPAGSTEYTIEVRLVNAVGNGQESTDQSVTSNAGSDVTAPSLSSATDAANGSSASTGSVSTDEGNGTLYWVVTTSATAPSVAQIQVGQDNSSVAAAASGSQSVSGTGVQTLSPAPSGLSASTAYTTHFQHQDAATNDSTVVSASGFTTDAAGDVTAPTLSSATDAANGSTASTGSVSTDEGNGSLYWVVTESATAPSVAQIQAGQDNSSVAAAASGSQSVSGTGVQTISPAPSGLSASTAYTTHFQHQDAATNDSTVVSASGFTTDAGASPQWTSLKTAGTVAIDGANSGGEWDPAPSVSNLAADDDDTANLFIGSGTTEYAEGVIVSNFGFTTGDIPASSTINGLEITIRGREAVAGRAVTVMGVQVTDDGGSTFIGTAKDDEGTLTGTDSDIVIGGASDLFGTSITDSDVRSSNFGFHFSFRATGDTPVLIEVEQVQVRVNYT